LPNSRILLFGLSAFFAAFSIDRITHARIASWHSDAEPYGFSVLALCLLYVTSQRITADEQRSVSLTDAMRAAKDIQETHFRGWSFALRYNLIDQQSLSNRTACLVAERS
jgi:hypothetical protein